VRGAFVALLLLLLHHYHRDYYSSTIVIAMTLPFPSSSCLGQPIPPAMSAAPRTPAIHDTLQPPASGSIHTPGAAVLYSRCRLYRATCARSTTVQYCPRTDALTPQQKKTTPSLPPDNSIPHPDHHHTQSLNPLNPSHPVVTV
jgi:hypothetical protein